VDIDKVAEEFLNKQTNSDVNVVARVENQKFWGSLWTDPEPSAAGTSNKSAISVDSSFDIASNSAGQDACNLFNPSGLTCEELDAKFYAGSNNLVKKSDDAVKRANRKLIGPPTTKIVINGKTRDTRVLEHCKINQRAVLNNLSNDARISVEAASNKVPKLTLNTTPTSNITVPDYVPNTAMPPPKNDFQEYSESVNDFILNAADADIDLFLWLIDTESKAIDQILRTGHRMKKSVEKCVGLLKTLKCKEIA